MVEDKDDVQQGAADAAEDAADKALADLKKDLDVVEVDEEGNEIHADDKDGDDERLGSEAQHREAESVEQRRARRREERHQRRDNQRRQLNEGRIAMRENAELRAQLIETNRRIEQLDLQQQNFGVVQLEARIAETRNLVRQMEGVEKAAATAGKKDDEIEARNLAQQARDNLRELERTYRQVEEAGGIPARGETRRATAGAADGGAVRTAPQVDPQIVGNFRAFHSRNQWYNPDVRVADQDSMVTRAIEAALAAEGSDPRTQEHWDELEDRLVEALPHRYNAREDNDRGGTRRASNNGSEGTTRQRTARERPPVSNGRDQGTGGNRRQVRISPERKAAMVEAGSWDDPVKRAAMIREYARWDAEHGGTRQ